MEIVCSKGTYYEVVTPSQVKIECNYDMLSEAVKYLEKTKKNKGRRFVVKVEWQEDQFSNGDFISSFEKRKTVAICEDGEVNVLFPEKDGAE